MKAISDVTAKEIVKALTHMAVFYEFEAKSRYNCEIDRYRYLEAAERTYALAKEVEDSENA